jgi:hypothetical protein
MCRGLPPCRPTKPVSSNAWFAEATEIGLVRQKARRRGSTERRGGAQQSTLLNSSCSSSAVAILKAEPCAVFNGALLGLVDQISWLIGVTKKLTSRTMRMIAISTRSRNGRGTETNVDSLLYAGNSLDEAPHIFAEAIRRRPRITLTIRQRTRVLDQYPTGKALRGLASV